MLDPRYPWLAVSFLTLIATGALVYYLIVASGLFKGSLMAHFRSYGPDKPLYPFSRLLDTLAVWSLMVSSMLDSLTMESRTDWVFAPAVFFSISLMAFAGSAITRWRPELRESLPRWYHELLVDSTRLERRHLAYAWLRIPRRMRWRLNSDQASFRVWADMVRLTAFYGARDPDDPWLKWK